MIWVFFVCFKKFDKLWLLRVKNCYRMLSMHRKIFSAHPACEENFQHTLSMRKMFWQFPKVIFVLAEHVKTHFQPMLSIRILLLAHGQHAQKIFLRTLACVKYKIANIILPQSSNKYFLQSPQSPNKIKLISVKNKRSKISHLTQQSITQHRIKLELNIHFCS